MQRIPSWFKILTCVLLAMYLCACHRPGPVAVQAMDAKRYDFVGKVVAVDKQEKRVQVAHDAIEDKTAGTVYMDAMTMWFPLHDDWAFDVLKPGDGLTATLAVAKESFWLEGITISQISGPAPAQPQAAATNLPEAGAVVPDIQLTNQDGKRVNLRGTAGQVTVITFIYTRCPIREFCSLMSTNFVALDKALQQIPDAMTRTHLYTITFEPERDTPEVLRTYGEALVRRNGEVHFDHWEFLTGSAADIKHSAAFFGLDYSPENGTIRHTLRTAVITPNGKVFKAYSGNQWKPEEVLADIKILLAATEPIK